MRGVSAGSLVDTIRRLTAMKPRLSLVSQQITEAVNESGYRSTGVHGCPSSDNLMSKASSEMLVVEPPGEKLEACVTVPVKDEEDLLPSALRALAEQKTITGDEFDHERYEVILLINNTRDRSRQVVEQFQRLY